MASTKRPTSQDPSADDFPQTVELTLYECCPPPGQAPKPLQLVRLDHEKHHPISTEIALRLALAATNDCETLSAVMHVLTLVGTENLTVRQVLFFLAVACMDLRGTPASPACLREIYGSLGRSIETSKDQLLTKTEQNPDALDWLVSEQDQNDRHCEYLRLTPKGREVIEALSKVMAGDTPQGPVN